MKISKQGRYSKNLFLTALYITENETSICHMQALAHNDNSNIYFVNNGSLSFSDPSSMDLIAKRT